MSTRFVRAENVGASPSLIVTVKLHERKLPLASVTVKVLVVVPLAKVDPLGNPAF